MGERATGGRSAQWRLFVQGPLQAPSGDVASGWLGGHLSGRLPPFSCERQTGRDRGLGAICWGSSLCETRVPPHGWRVEGKPTEGAFRAEGGSAGQACSVTICARPSWTAWAQPPLRPPPRPRPDCADAGVPSPPQGRPWSQGLPSRPSYLSHGAASTGDGSGNHLWVTRRLSSWGTPSSTDLAWMPGRPRRGGWGLPRRGQEGTASLCRRAAPAFPGREVCVRSLQGLRASDAPGSGRPSSLARTQSDAFPCFS